MPSKRPTKLAGAYRVLVGISYGADDRHVEPGEIVDDLEDGNISWMLAAGVIEPVED